MFFGRVKTHYPAIGADNSFSRKVGSKVWNRMNIELSENLSVWSAAIETLAINLPFFMTGNQAKINISDSIEAQYFTAGIGNARMLFSIWKLANSKCLCR